MAQLFSKVTRSTFYTFLLAYLIVQLIHHIALNSVTTGVASFWNLIHIIVEAAFIAFVANSLYGTATGKIGRLD